MSSAKCPKCESISKDCNWTKDTGTVNTCLDCGHVWKPRKKQNGTKPEGGKSE